MKYVREEIAKLNWISRNTTLDKKNKGWINILYIGNHGKIEEEEEDPKWSDGKFEEIWFTNL